MFRRLGQADSSKSSAIPKDVPCFDCGTVVWQHDSHLIFARQMGLGAIQYDPSFKSWVVLGHAEVSEALTSDGSFNKEYSRGFDRYMNSGDASERRHAKRCMKSSLTFDREGVAATAEDWMDGFLERSRTFDAVADFGVPLPRRFTSNLLGLDDSRVQRIVSRLSANRTDIGSSMEGVGNEISRILEEKRQEPRYGLISDILHADPAQGMTDDQMVVMVRHIWFAGTVTLSTALPASILWLSRRPDLADELRRHPEKVPNFFSEVLRLESPTQFVPRVCVEDLDFHGRRIKKGDLVRLCLASANRDPRVFPNPDSIDLERPAYRNLAMGYGDHFCLGALHARTIAETAIRRILNASSAIRVLTRENELEYEKSPIFRALKRLDVVLE